MTKKSNIIPFPSSPGQVFRFEVEIMSGPVPDDYMDSHPDPPTRIIEAHGANTLDDLHWAIFEAFDRDDAHCYQFELGGKKPMDRKASIYGIDECNEFVKDCQDAQTTLISALPLRVNQCMFYWFDFGDDWWHSVTLLAVENSAAKKDIYPRVVARKGESPPQYAFWDEGQDHYQDDDDDDDDAYSVAASHNMVSRIVESARQERKGKILTFVANFCSVHLDEEYGKACLVIFEEAWKKGLMLDRSREASWAAGIVQTVAVINFIYDPSTVPYLKADDIAKHFGVAKSTMSSKGEIILEALRALPLDPRYCVEALLKDNPLVKMMELGMFGKGAKRKM